MIPLALLGVVLLCLAVRIGVPWSNVFHDGFVDFQDPDSWYHMRLIDNLVRNFPYPLTVDPYLGRPDIAIPAAPLFDVIVAGVAWVLGAGHPSDRLVDFSGAFVPPALAAITVVVAYLITARLFDRSVGLLSAAILACIPGDFMRRSLLGFADHHAAEVLFCACTVLFLIMAMQTPAGADRAARRRPTLLSGAAGLALGAYFLTWASAAFLASLLCLWIFVQYMVDHLRGRSVDHVTRVLAPALLTALVVVLAFRHPKALGYGSQVLSLAVGVVTTLSFEGLRRLGHRLGVQGPILAVAFPALLLVGGVLVWFGESIHGVRIAAQLRRLTGGHSDSHVQEVYGLLRAADGLTLVPLVSFFGATLLLALPALIVPLRGLVRVGRADHGLLVVLMLGFVGATLVQQRFSYYLALPAAVLAALACVAIARRILKAPVPANQAKRRVEPESRGFVRPALAVVVVGALGFAPSLWYAFGEARFYRGVGLPTYQILSWLRKSSPEPFGDPQAYYARSSAVGKALPSYNVMAWWDFGYQILRIAHRVPLAFPTQKGAATAARFFLETDEVRAMSLLNMHGAAYLFTEKSLAFHPDRSGDGWTGRFPALASWAGRPLSDFMEVVVQRKADGSLERKTVFYPSYFQSMAVLTAVFGGQAAPAMLPVLVASLGNPAASSGPVERELLAVRSFGDHIEATSYVASQPMGTASIVSFDPAKACVPVEALRTIRPLTRQLAEPGMPVRLFRWVR